MQDEHRELIAKDVVISEEFGIYRPLGMVQPHKPQTEKFLKKLLRWITDGEKSTKQKEDKQAWIQRITTQMRDW